MDPSRIEASSLQMQGSDVVVRDASPAERMAAVWQLTLDAWAFKDPQLAESRFQRHVVRVVRGGR